ncbi:transposable element Tcb2 transposase [Trichonephila clavipes]|nr:transposable element Tcb2 transposase [Trichonephila clavipes]
MPKKDRSLTIKAHCHRDLLAKELAQDFAVATRNTICRQTVYRRLAEKSLSARRFSINSDSRRVFIWREPGTRYHPYNITESDRFGGCGVLVWGGIILDSRTPLHIFDAGSVNAQRYKDDILESRVRLFRGAIGQDFIFMDDNARPPRVRFVEDFLEEADICQQNFLT